MGKTLAVLVSVNRPLVLDFTLWGFRFLKLELKIPVTKMINNSQIEQSLAF